MGCWVFRQVRKGDRFAGACLLSHEQHDELVADYEARLAAGVQPSEAWRAALLRARLVPAWVLSTMLELERRRLRAGIAGDALCVRAGLAERAYGKWLRPWRSAHCRLPSRPVLTVLAWTLAGCEIEQMMCRV